MEEDGTYVAFLPGVSTALTVASVKAMLVSRDRRDVMAGGMMCSQGHRVTPVICATRRSHFRHVRPQQRSERRADGPVTPVCGCIKNRVHSQAQQMLRDHDYEAYPIEFVQWYGCKQHFGIVYVADCTVYPEIEVTERHSASGQMFRTDVVYKRRADGSFDQRLEVLHQHDTRTDGARSEVSFLQVDATHVRDALARGEHKLRVETVHQAGCPTCAEERRRRADEARAARWRAEQARLAEERRQVEEEARRRWWAALEGRRKLAKALRVCRIYRVFVDAMLRRLNERAPMWAKIKARTTRLLLDARRRLRRKKQMQQSIVARWTELLRRRRELRAKLTTSSHPLGSALQRWIRLAQIRERETYDRRNPDKAAERARALRRYAKYNDHIEARHLSYLWRDPQNLTGAARQASFDAWNVQLRVAVREAKRRLAEAQTEGGARPPKTPPTTTLELTDIERDLEIVFRSIRSYEPTYAPPSLDDADADPKAILAVAKQKLEACRESWLRSRVQKRRRETIELHEMARAEAVSYAKRNDARFWLASNGSAIMHVHPTTKKKERLCAPGGCRVCRLAQSIRE